LVERLSAAPRPDANQPPFQAGPPATTIAYPRDATPRQQRASALLRDARAIGGFSLRHHRHNRGAA